MCNYTEIFQEVLARYGNHVKWDDGAFHKIKVVSNTNVGSVGQDFIERLCGELGLQCEFPTTKKGKRATHSPWDVKIEGLEMELKTASEDVNGSFQFNHLRYHRTYDAVLCLGVAPDALYFGCWSKAEIATGKAGRLVTMEKAANASYKLTKTAAHLHPIAEFGEIIRAFVVLPH